MRQQMNLCACGWSPEKSAQPWRFYSVSGSELLKSARAAWLKSQYAKMRKTTWKQCNIETCWEAWVLLPQSNSFTWGNVRGSALSCNKLPIGFNSWTTKGWSESCEAGLESSDPATVPLTDLNLHMSNAGKEKWLKEQFRGGKSVSVLIWSKANLSK